MSAGSRVAIGREFFNQDRTRSVRIKQQSRSGVKARTQSVASIRNGRLAKLKSVRSESIGGAR
jgi:hypothetical protein